MSPPPAPPPPLVWRRRGYLLTGAGAAFLVLAVVLLGLGVRDPVMILVAVPLLVAPIAAAITSPRPAPTVALAWRATGGSGDVRIAGVLSVNPPSASDDLTLSFPRPSELTEVRRPRVGWFPGSVRFDLAWRSDRPVLEAVRPPAATWTDPMGVVGRPIRLATAPLIVERFPLELLKLGAVRLERTRQLPGRTRTRQIGLSGEYFGIRPAAPDEPPRRINWRASARAGTWLANEFEVERTGDLLLLIDTRPSSLGPAIDDRFLGVARAAATGVATAFLRQKARVGYASFGEFLETVPLGSGRTQSVRIRNAIRTTRRSTVVGPSERCAVSARRFYPGGVTTLLLSTLAGDDACDLVAHLKHRGYPTIVLNPSWHALAPRRPVLSSREADLATRLANLERRMRLAATRVYASVVDWEDLGSLGELAHLLSRPVRRRI